MTTFTVFALHSWIDDCRMHGLIEASCQDAAIDQFKKRFPEYEISEIIEGNELSDDDSDEEASNV